MLYFLTRLSIWTWIYLHNRIHGCLVGLCFNYVSIFFILDWSITLPTHNFLVCWYYTCFFSWVLWLFRDHSYDSYRIQTQIWAVSFRLAWDHLLFSSPLFRTLILHLVLGLHSCFLTFFLVLIDSFQVLGGGSHILLYFLHTLWYWKLI